MKKRKGFSLLELVVVLCIIAILMSVVSVKLTGRVSEARALAIETDLQILVSGGEMYASRYPTQSANDQETLVCAGCLKERLESPIEGYTYQVEVANGQVRAWLAKGESIYEKGDFRAEKLS